MTKLELHDCRKCEKGCECSCHKLSKEEFAKDYEKMFGK